MSRVFITGDLHGHIDIRKLTKYNFPEGQTLTKNDYVIICGDFGLVFDPADEVSEREEYWLSWLNGAPWTTLFVDGNHENFDRLNSYPVEDWNGGKVHRIRQSILHLMRGQIFTINGYKWFTYGGAESVDRAYRVPYVSWWPQETPSYKEYNEAVSNLEKVDYKVDFIITHAMPQQYIENMFYSSHPKSHTESNGTPYQLQDFKRMCEYKEWYCGHYHMDVDMNESFHILYEKIIEVDFDKEK